MSNSLSTNLNTQTAITAISLENLSIISKTFPSVETSFSHTGGAIIRTAPTSLRAVSSFLANSSLFRATILVDIAVVDKLGANGRFVVKYAFLSSFCANRISLETYVDETTSVPSLACAFFANKAIFASAGWLEREAWDLFGVFFTQNKDLRRILTDYGFQGHPLRKDFPLTGFTELVYNDAEGRVTVEPVELAQEFRVFHI